MRTPESDKFTSLVDDLAKLTDRFHQFAASDASERSEAAVLGVCDTLADALHKGRRTLRLMELNHVRNQ